MYKLVQFAQNKTAKFVTLSLLGLMLMPGAALGVAKGGDCDSTATKRCDDGLRCVSGTCVSNSGTTDFGVGETETGLKGVLGNRPLIDTATQIINVALSLLGLVAVVIVLIGGFKWMTAGGNEEKVTEGRKFITSGVIGLAIIFSAFAITKFVIGNLSQATDSGNVPLN